MFLKDFLFIFVEPVLGQDLPPKPNCKHIKCTARTRNLVDRCHDKEDAFSCLVLGLEISEGTSFPPDPRNIFLYLKKSCQGGEVMGCLHVAELEIEGRGTRLNVRHGIKTMEKYCHDKELIACIYLGWTYRWGKSGRVLPDGSKAVKYYSMACDLDAQFGCLESGEIYFKGEGVLQDHKKSYPLFRKACDVNNSQSCYYLGIMYRDGLGIDKDESSGYALFSKACDIDGHEYACRAAGFSSTSVNDP